MKVLVLHVENKPHAAAGLVLDLPDLEAQDMIRRGAAVLAPDAPEPASQSPAPKPVPEPAVAKEPKAERPHARNR